MSTSVFDFAAINRTMKDKGLDHDEPAPRAEKLPSQLLEAVAESLDISYAKLLKDYRGGLGTRATGGVVGGPRPGYGEGPNGYCYKGTWNAFDNYLEDDMVVCPDQSGNSDDDEYYACKTSINGAKPCHTPAFWRPMTLREVDLVLGRPTRKTLPKQQPSQAQYDPSMTWKGMWDKTAVYKAGDIVHHDGAKFRCLSDNAGYEPTKGTFWQMEVQPVLTATQKMQMQNRLLRTPTVKVSFPHLKRPKPVDRVTQQDCQTYLSSTEYGEVLNIVKVPYTKRSDTLHRRLRELFNTVRKNRQLYAGYSGPKTGRWNGSGANPIPQPKVDEPKSNPGPYKRIDTDLFRF